MSGGIQWSDMIALFERAEESYEDVGSLYDSLMKGMVPMSRYFGVAKVEVHVSIRPNPYYPNGMNFHYETRFLDGQDPYSRGYMAVNHFGNGTVKLLLFPVTGRTWDDEDKIQMEVFSKIITTIMNRGALNQSIVKATRTDPLTGLPNTMGVRIFHRQLAEKEVLQDYTGIFCNLKSFKLVNQEMGSEMGDQLLKAFGRKIREQIDPSCEQVARLGGDNFFITVQTKHLDVMLRMIPETSVDVEQSGALVKVPILSRAGIYSGGKNEDPESLISFAAMTLERGRRDRSSDVFYFRKELVEQIMVEKKYTMELPVALQKEELIPFFQPKIDINTEQSLGAEALVRWNHNGKEILTPSEFLPALEREARLIQEVDIYMLRQVCKYIRRWLDMGIDPGRISVNYSRQNLRNPDIVDITFSILDENEIDGRYIEIELTETTDLTEMAPLSHFIASMHERGIHVSMDDFGTGYSSVSLLENLDFNVVKLDRSFMTRISNKEKKVEIIIRNVVKMLNELGVQVIAEGVETREQLDMVKKAGVDVVQGFLFEKPLPPKEFEAWMKQQ
ncbi:MAG: GGDEF domain-containing phosphodiesterase [Lachnospiraceae bacterium]|nr:GGDEF domain-containing phosphodiesterase [Lachnospiraceae bacterium]